MTRSRYRTGRFVACGALSLATGFLAQPVVAVSANSAPPPARTVGGRAGNGRAGAAQPTERVVVLLKAPCPVEARVSAGRACPAQGPVLSELRAHGARVLATTTLVDSITAAVSPAEAGALGRSPGVSHVIPDAPLSSSPAPSAAAAGTAGPVAPSAVVPHHLGPTKGLCGTKSAPELDPQALQVIHANQARAAGVDGSGVTVAILADGLAPGNPDFVRNHAYGPARTPVITTYQDFSGDGTAAKTQGAEAFGDASSIAAQGNKAYNISRFVSPGMAALLPTGGCWVKIVGAAPGASLLALKIFGQNGAETGSGFVQAIQYAVQHGAKVINESFGSEPFPDTTLDLVRNADDAAVAAGVTVVVSTGDGGTDNTIGSPATDPNVISVGATTTFRFYAQANFGGFYNPIVGNGKWVSNNISSLSSAGYSQSGGTVDLVAPGDSNWALCSADFKLYTECSDSFGGRDNGVQSFGGTSEASPLTAAAAADVIQAYAKAHGGVGASPALVKQILCSTATDIGAPAVEEGAGLLNVFGAVKLAESLPAPPNTTTTTATAATTGTTTTTTATATITVTASAERPASPRAPAAAAPAPPSGTLLISPDQVNVVGQAGVRTAHHLSLTNTGPTTTTVRLSTRALTDKIYDTGTREFSIDPSQASTNMGTIPIWSGVSEVYQTETFEVPPSSASRLIFSADYQDTGQSSVLHFALFEPNGTYANYSDPQGLGDYGEVEVSRPPAGKWTALFFTEQNGATRGAHGTRGTVQWDASVWHYERGASVSPSSLTIGAGQTATATLSVRDPRLAGDTDQSVVISTSSGQTTVPVTVRTMIPVGAQGGTFKGMLTGGNGRAGSVAQTNTYYFNVPPGKADLGASIALRTDPDEGLVGYLVTPSGQTVGNSSNYTFVPSGSSFAPKAAYGLVPGSTPYLQMYNVSPEAGQWELVLQWDNPVTGNELVEPFSGSIRFNLVQATEKGLPESPATKLVRGQPVIYRVDVANTGVAPGAYFVDPRLDRTTTVTLKNLLPGTSASRLHLPRKPSTMPFPPGIPLYLVPPGTTRLSVTVSRLAGTRPVSFDMHPVDGDPDIASGVTATGVTNANTPGSDSLSLSEPEVAPGLWSLIAGEVGPYPVRGAPREIVDAKVTAVTQAFDPTVRSDTNDLWQVGFQFSHFHYLEPGQSAAINLEITPTAAVGTHVSGTLYIDGFTLGTFLGIQFLPPNADEVAAIPYSYTVSAD